MIFSTHGARTVGYSHTKNEPWATHLAPYIVIVEWITDLNLELKITKIIEENMEENICDLKLVKHFLGKIPNVWIIFFKSCKLDFINVKPSAFQKAKWRILKEKPPTGKIYLQSTLIKDLYPKYIKNSHN